jgi:hypothetical protein
MFQEVLRQVYTHLKRGEDPSRMFAGEGGPEKELTSVSIM